MVDFMRPIRQELNRLRNSLENDIDEFNNRLNLTRQNMSHYIDQQIEYLLTIKNNFNDEFNYLENENAKTCRDNQQEFDKLCLSINQNDHDSSIVTRLLERFKQTFPMRPTMLKSIPEYDFKNIQIDDFIIKQNSSKNSLSPVINKSLNNGFHPIDEQPKSPLPTTTIGSSYHKELASKNIEDKIEPQSRLVSRVSAMSEYYNKADILFRINYDHNRSRHLICYNEEDNCLLLFSFSLHKFQLLNLNTREFSSINYSIDEYILNIGYCSTYHFYYYTARQANNILLFRLNEKEIEILENIELIKAKDYFINVHIYENCIYFLYLTPPSIVMFGKYNLDDSSILSSTRFENRFYENGEKTYFKIIDFTINNEFICLLTQFKNNNKSKIILYDSQTMNKLHSFDLIDAVKPMSIISTTKKSGSNSETISNDNIELLLYINDPDSRLVHCCSYEEYLMTTRTNNYGICSLDDGNLVLITEKDIRLLNIQDSIKKNRELFY